VHSFPARAIGAELSSFTQGKTLPKKMALIKTSKLGAELQQSLGKYVHNIVIITQFDADFSKG
jgi:hypothetical protein